jgi:hypothetical protein
MFRPAARTGTLDRGRDCPEREQEVPVIDRNQVSEGMVVRCADGKKLGRVLACTEGSFIVERGFFFATDYMARYGDVSDISGGEVRLSRSEEELAHAQRAVVREGGLGESITLGLGSGLDTAQPWARADEEEEQVRRGGVRGDEGKAGTKYDMGGHSGSTPTSHGDEGGSGDL